MRTLSFILALFAISTAVFAQKGGKPKINPKAVKCFDQAYTEFEKGNITKALSLLKKSLKADPKYAEAYSLQAVIYEGKKDTGNALKAYRNCLKYDPVYQANYFYMAKYLFKLDRYAEAIGLLEKFRHVSELPGFNPKKDGASEIMQKNAARLAESAKQAQADKQNMDMLEIRNVGPGINTSTYEYWPGMTIDGKTFIFTRLIRKQGAEPHEDFYISALKDTVWQNAVQLPGEINTDNNEGTTAVSADGRFIYYTVCNQDDGLGGCDIYSSVTDGINWSPRKNAGRVINSPAWDAQPTLSADGRTLVFASARPGGMGGKDLWQSQWQNGAWTTPVNLGKDINTDSDEEAPYLHYDGTTLYFASDGHPGYGSHDLFVSRRQPDGSWSKPVNMGRGINTDRDEVGLYVDYKGDKAYFASDRPGGFGNLDIYSFKLTEDKKPKPVTYVKGKVVHAVTGEALAGRIELVDLGTGHILLSDSSREFFTMLQPSGNYAMNVYRQGFLLFSENFQPTAASVDNPFLFTARLQPILADQSMVLKNIFFDVDKFDLKAESHSELDKLALLLRGNPGMVIEISGHTDNTGSEDHNKTLSENRARSVQIYLSAHGVKDAQLKFKGYGSSKPVMPNDTEEGKAANRRIEMKVVSVGK
ncbi:MAG: PD40 domain-containing protein [Bacteroidetes bacterium]|nr:PD40 domain-containing protein [Bacteroidota bacterium]